MTDTKIKIHCMGIGGSGMSAVAALAKSSGYQVSGCDKEESTPYIEKLRKEVDISVGHSKEHVKDADILLVTPAVYFNEQKDEELSSAKKVMTWQEFLGKNLMEDREVISVCGTHGKSTTTAMLSLVFEEASRDPNVMVGATVPNWQANYRSGKGKEFIVEADEFYDNFLNYHPDVIVLNNIEYDHPDFFPSKEKMVQSFEKFVSLLQGRKTLIYNKDSEEVIKLVEKVDKNKTRLVNYSLKDSAADYFPEIISKDESGTEFRLLGSSYKINLAGNYNVANTLGVIAASTVYSIKPEIIAKGLLQFKGIGRRMEVVGEFNGAPIYDDYAHHPTAIRETLNALKQKHPNKNIIAIVEPHSYSRTKALLSEYKDVFVDADEVIIAPIFKARDSETFGINEESIMKVSNHKNIKFINSIDEIVRYLKNNITKEDAIICMGAGKSYEIPRKLLS